MFDDNIKNDPSNHPFAAIPGGTRSHDGIFPSRWRWTGYWASTEKESIYSIGCTIWQEYSELTIGGHLKG